MTACGDMSAAGLRLLDLLTASEAAAALTRDLGAPCSAGRVRRLADAGEVVRVRFGAAVRYTPESAAACRQRQAAGAVKAS